MWPLASALRAASKTGMPCISLGSTCYTYPACCWRRLAITACSLLPVASAQNGKQPHFLLFSAALSPVLAVRMLSCRLLGSSALWELRNNLQGLSSLCKVVLHASMLSQYRSSSCASSLSDGLRWGGCPLPCAELGVPTVPLESQWRDRQYYWCGI